jgi:hypothetical protein
MKTYWLSKMIRNPAVPALALVLATVTASSAVAARETSTHMKRGQIHFEAVVPQNTQQDNSWYKPARSPAFDPSLYGG